MAKLAVFPLRVFTTTGTLAAGSGYKLYGYEAGTATPKAFYTDATGDTAFANPATIGSTGTIAVWLGEGSYKFTLTDSSGNVQDGYPIDNVQGLSTNIEVDSIADLKALEPGGSTYVYVGGYTTIGDGGEGHFYWDANSTDSDNAGTIIEANAAPATGRWIRLGDLRILTPQMFGAKADGSTNDITAIQAAIDALPTGGGGKVLFSGRYAIEDEIVVNKRAVTLEGKWVAGEVNGAADVDSMCEILYNGSQNNAKSCIFVDANSHNFSCANLFLNSNDLSGFGLYQEGVGTPAQLTRGSEVKNITFRGYRVAAWVIGDSSDTPNDAQFQLVTASNIYMRGGADSLGANGLHINAQNLEFISINGLYIDPRSSENRHHTNHIRQILGGINISGFLSTRAGTTTLINGYAIYSRDQLIINGWRTEDRYLLDQPAVGATSSSFISGLSQRPDDPAETVSTAEIIRIKHSDVPISLIGPSVNGTISIGATNDIRVNIVGFNPLRAGATITYAGPQNSSGMFHKIDEGDFLIKGTTPNIETQDELGNSLFKVQSGNIHIPRTSPSQITGNQNDYDPGDGSFIRISTDADRTITGFANGANGKFFFLTQTSAFTLTLSNQSGSSSTANRIICATGSDILLTQNEMAGLIWDVSTNRWRAFRLGNPYIGTIIGTGVTTAGTIFRTSTSGISHRAYTGSTYDWTLRDASDNNMLVNYTGTDRLTFLTRSEFHANDSLTASTTQTQGQQALTANINIVSTVANANDVVTLPSAADGAWCYIRNNGANILQIFPASGDAINSGAVDASTTLAAGASVRYYSANTTNWYS